MRDFPVVALHLCPAVTDDALRGSLRRWGLSEPECLIQKERTMVLDSPVEHPLEPGELALIQLPENSLHKRIPADGRDVPQAVFVVCGLLRDAAADPA